VEKQDVRSATFVLDLGLVRVRKIYELTDSKSPGKGYELFVRHAIENTSQQPVKVKVAFTGPTTPPRESERGPDLQVIAAYASGYGAVAVDHHMVDEYDTTEPEREPTKNGDGKPVLWAATLSVYVH